MKKTNQSKEQRILMELLRQAREEADLTQEMLAERLNVPQSRISDYERGIRQMDVLVLYQYCKAIDVTLVQFVQRFVVELEEKE